MLVYQREHTEIMHHYATKSALIKAVKDAINSSLIVGSYHVRVINPLFEGYSLRAYRGCQQTFVELRHDDTGDNVWNTPVVYVSLAVDLAVQEGKLPVPTNFWGEADVIESASVMPKSEAILVLDEPV